MNTLSTSYSTIYDINEYLNEFEHMYHKVQHDYIYFNPIFKDKYKSYPAAILLSKIIYLYNKKRKPFYKFIKACKHKKYKKGNSWTEELHISKDEYATAIKKIGTKININKEIPEHDKPIEYWRTFDGITYYQINYLNLSKLHGFT